MQETILTVASLITALGVILGAVFSFHSWYLNTKKQGEAIKELKEEQKVLIHGILACLKGLKEQGCDGEVTEEIERIENHINTKAHKI